MGQGPRTTIGTLVKRFSSVSVDIWRDSGKMLGG